MALWGKRDSKSASGLVQISSDGYVTGNGTYFTEEARIGDTMIVGDNQYVIVVIDSDTEATVTMAKHGAEIVPVGSDSEYNLNEKPVYVSQSESSDTSTDSGDSSVVYGVSWDEMTWNPGFLTDIALVQGGSNYTEVPGVIIQSGEEGQAYAEATMIGGVVTKITLTNNGGGGYNAVPNVYVQVPRRTVPTGNVNTTTETIGYEGHNLNTGDALTYYGSGLSVSCGDEDTVWVIKVDDDNFKLAASLINAQSNTPMNLTSTGSSGQYFDLHAPAGVTATAKAVLGTGTDIINGQSGPVGYSNWVSGEQHVTHAGWVRKTVGTGGRAGRVQYETLVAMGSIQGDQSNDTAFPNGD